MATNTTKSIHSLVIDAGPIIKNEPSVSALLSQAEKLYTIPAIVSEIRDAPTRARIESTLLPFLTLRSPRPESIKIITDFSRRTGDLEVLSRPDIHLMALAYELECERNHGDWRLRSLPGQKRLNGAPPAALTGMPASGELVRPEMEVQDTSSDATSSSCSAIDTGRASGIAIPAAEELEPIDKLQSRDTEESIEDTSINMTEPGKANALESTLLNKEAAQAPVMVTAVDNGEPLSEFDSTVEEVQSSESGPSDDEGWITPSNLKKHLAKDTNGSVEPQDDVKTMQVALITSDFAMQNVLLRMNLNLLSTSLQRIRQLKTWVLRCHACFEITRDMSKQFCGRCGKPTLLRTSCSTDKDGSFKVHLKKNMQWNTRGNVYSIPKPVAGSSNGKLLSGGGKGGWGQGLILAEDQKEYVQAMTSARRRKERDLMDEDYLPGLLSGDRGNAGGRPKVGAGKNVNSRKRN